MKVSVSALKTFKACRRMFELRYIENLESVQSSDALETGSSYHENLEKLYSEGDFDCSERTKADAMAMAYKKYIYPMFKVKSVETWMDAELYEGANLIGRLDGISEDGCIVEHKTVSAEITEAYEYDLQWDEQMLAYMYMTGARDIYYTVCRKPTIRQKKNESDEDFFYRMVEWYDYDTDSKIRLFKLSRTDEEVQRFVTDAKNTARQIEKMFACPEMHMNRNTLHCFRWGRRCEYAPICLEYDPAQKYVEFVKKEDSEYGTSKD